jgi:hypothetical protein
MGVTSDEGSRVARTSLPDVCDMERPRCGNIPQCLGGEISARSIALIMPQLQGRIGKFIPTNPRESGHRGLRPA